MRKVPDRRSPSTCDRTVGDSIPEQPTPAVPRDFVIPEPMLVGLLQYLATRPYNEVNQAINELQRLQPTEQTDQPSEDIAN